MTFEALGGAYGSMIWSLGDPRVGCDLGQAVPFPDLSFPPQKKKKKKNRVLYTRPSGFKLLSAWPGRNPLRWGKLPPPHRPGQGRGGGGAWRGSGPAAPPAAAYL